MYYVGGSVDMKSFENKHFEAMFDPKRYLSLLLVYSTFSDLVWDWIIHVPTPQEVCDIDYKCVLITFYPTWVREPRLLSGSKKHMPNLR